MASTKADLIIKTPEQIRQDFKEDLQVGFQNIGLNANVSDASVYGPMSHGIANVISPIYFNISLLADQMMPDTAEGEELDRIVDAVGLARKMPSNSYSSFIHRTLAATNYIPAGSELITLDGVRFRTLITGNYKDGDVIQIVSAAKGESTNLEQGTRLKWSQPPAQASDPILAEDSLGGSSLETDDELRARYFTFVSNPPTSGNSSHVALEAEAYSSIIEKAYVYPAVSPSNVRVVLTKAQHPTTYSRFLSSQTVDNCHAHLQGKMPESIDYRLTSVIDIPCSVAIGLNIPNARGSEATNNAATGSGWIDVKPFPRASNTVIPTITTITPFFIEVQCLPGDAPINNQTNVSWFKDGVVKSARITSSLEIGAGSGLWRLNLSVPWTNSMSVGDYLFPSCVNAQLYMDTIIESFAKLGPTEITTSPALLPRSLRRPYPSDSNPSTISYSMIRDLYDNNDEILDAEFLYRAFGANPPTPPPNTNNAPGIFIPNKIGVYPK